MGIIAIAIIAGGMFATAVSAAPARTPRAAIGQVLDASAAAWSIGDLDQFMQCYESGPAPTYVKAAGVVHGYQAIRDMYAGRFSGKAAMGKLSMTVLDYHPLGASYALVTGRYLLERPPEAGGQATGIFTLVFHKSSAGWRIISDHTS